MECTLHHEDTTVRVSAEGAYIREVLRGDTTLIAPQHEVTLDDGTVKLRGGCHVCIPQFGPAESLPQHGYARHKTWHIDQCTEDSVTLSLASGEGDYRQLASVVTYSVGARGLVISLALINKGDRPLRAAPGIHPYFARQSDQPIELDERLLDPEAAAMTEFVGGESHDVRIGDMHYTCESSNLTTWAIWTDNPAAYICIEPTYAGYAFTREMTEDEELAPGEQRVYDFTITWA